MCHGNNWSFHCANARHDKWCYQAQEGCPLNSYEKFDTMTECQLYMRRKLNKSLKCMYHCDETSNSINTCIQSPQICVKGFHESQPPGTIVKYDKRGNVKDIPSIANNSWCRLTDRKWYSSYDNCVNGINPVTTPGPTPSPTQSQAQKFWYMGVFLGVVIALMIGCYMLKRKTVS